MLFCFFFIMTHYLVWSTLIRRSVDTFSPLELPPIGIRSMIPPDFVWQNIIRSSSALLSVGVNHIYFGSGIFRGLFGNYFFYLSNDVSYHGILIINTLFPLFRPHFRNYTGDWWACCEYCRLQTQFVKKFSFRITFIVLQ